MLVQGLDKCPSANGKSNCRQIAPTDSAKFPTSVLGLKACSCGGINMATSIGVIKTPTRFERVAAQTAAATFPLANDVKAIDD